MQERVSPEEAIVRAQAIWDLDIEARLSALIIVANAVTVIRPPSWDYAAARSAPMRWPDKPSACFACATQAAKLYLHHIVPIGRGGENDPWNVVAICHECHRHIHPWLPEGTTFERRDDLMSLADWLKERMRRLGWRKR